MDKLIEYIQELLEQLGLGTIEASFYLINIVVFILLFRYFLCVLSERQNILEEYKLEKFNTLNMFIKEYKVYKSDDSGLTELIASLYAIIPFANKKLVDKITFIEDFNEEEIDNIYIELKSYFDLARVDNKVTHILNNHESVFGVFESFFRMNGIIQLIITFVYSFFSWFGITAVLLMIYRFYDLSNISRVLLMGLIIIGAIYMFLLLFVLDGLAYKGVKINLAYIICIIVSFLAPYTAAFENYITIFIYGGSFIYLLIMAVHTKKEISHLP